MVTASIHLSEQESRALQALARQTGKTQEELLHEAVTGLLSRAQRSERRALLQQARGIWKDRTDLPALETLRAEFDQRSFR
jgi:predicted transcriptional regulator